MTQPDPSAQSGAADPQSGVAGQQQGTPSTTPTPAEPAQSGQQQQGAQVSREDYDALQKRLQAADKNQSDLQAKLKAHEDAKLSEQEKVTRDLQQAQAELKAKDDQINSLQLEIAFLSDNTHTWHNPRTALAMADKAAIEWKDGKPSNVKAVLDSLAKDHPYLVKPADQEPVTPGAPSGLPMNNGNRNTSGNLADLERRYPALRGRVPKRS